jgi:hypothetical protein
MSYVNQPLILWVDGILRSYIPHLVPTRLGRWDRPILWYYHVK